MRVAMVHQRIGGPAGGGGDVRQMYELALGLKRSGHEVSVVCHDFIRGSDMSDGAERKLDVHYVTDTPQPPLAGLRAELETWRRMRRVADLVPSGVDVVNAHGFPGLRAGRMAASRLGIPLVWTRNDETLYERAVIPGETTVAPASARERLAHAVVGAADLYDARRASVIVVLDTRNAAMVAKAYRRKAEILRSGPAPSFFDSPKRAEARRSLGLADGEFVVFAFGILFPHRRIEDLVAAVALDADRATRLLVAGSDHAYPQYADELERLMQAPGLAGRAELQRASLTDEHLRAAYVAADVFVFPNDRQTWGLAPLEALACGTPAIVSRGAGVHEVLEGRDGVRLVPPRAPEALAKAIAAVRADPARREAAARTRDWIRSELTIDAYTQRMAELLSRVTA